MTSGSAPENPFAPSALPDLPRAPEQEPTRKRPMLVISILTWTGVCIASAAPSYIWGFMSIAANQHLAMWTGITMFIALYVLLDQSSLAAQLRKNKLARLTMRITYGTRIFISVLFPVGMAADVLCGFASMSILGFMVNQAGNAGQMLDGGEQDFAFCLALTLTQGLILNAVLATYGLIVMGLIQAIVGIRDRLA